MQGAAAHSGQLELGQVLQELRPVGALHLVRVQLPAGLRLLLQRVRAARTRLHTSHQYMVPFHHTPSHSGHHLGRTCCTCAYAPDVMSPWSSPHGAEALPEGGVCASANKPARTYFTHTPPARAQGTQQNPSGGHRATTHT